MTVTVLFPDFFSSAMSLAEFPLSLEYHAASISVFVPGKVEFPPSGGLFRGDVQLFLLIDIFRFSDFFLYLRKSQEKTLLSLRLADSVFYHRVPDIFILS